jgi:hypothetical protein
MEPSGDETGSASGLSQQPGEAEGSLTPEARGKVASSPDNDGTGRHCQTARVRQARRKAYARNRRLKAPQVKNTGSNLADMGRTAVHVCVDGATPKPVFDRRWGGHGEGLRRTRGEAAGAQSGADPANRLMVNVGTISVPPHRRSARPVAGRSAVD